MSIIKKIWNKITHTNALDQASGELEIAIFEDVYRVSYATGLSTTDRTIPYMIYSTTIKIMAAMIVVGEVWYACCDAQNLDEVAACVGVIVIQVIALYKVQNTRKHSAVYEKLAKCMDSTYFDQTTEKRREVVKYWTKTHFKFVRLLLGLGNSTLAVWYIYPLLDEIDYNLMLGFHLPFSYESPLLYPITYLMIMIAFTYTAECVMVTDLVMQAHLVPLICQLTILSDCFENIVRDCSDRLEDILKGDLTSNNEFIRKYLARLGILVNQHKLILRYSMDLRAILSGPMLGQMAASGTLLCFVSYQATTSIVENLLKCLTNLFFLGYNTFVLYIICCWYEEITIQSQNVGNAVYCSGWEEGMSTIPGVRSTLLLIIIRASKPLVFTAGGMYELSLQSFATLVKSSYSALTMLLRFRHE